MADTKRKGDPRLAKRIIDSIRKYSGKTQSEVAAELGVTPQSVSRWISLGYMKKERMPSFCKVCGVNIDWFLTGVGDPLVRNPFDGMTEDQIIQAMLEYLSPDEQWRLVQDLVAQVAPTTGVNG